jgi:hypothetical protein
LFTAHLLVQPNYGDNNKVLKGSMAREEMKKALEEK